MTSSAPRKTMDTLTRLIFRAFLILYLICQIVGSSYLAYFVSHQLRPYFAEHDTAKKDGDKALEDQGFVQGDRGNARIVYIYLCAAAVFASLGLVVAIRSFNKALHFFLISKKQNQNENQSQDQDQGQQQQQQQQGNKQQPQEPRQRRGPPICVRIMSFFLLGSATIAMVVLAAVTAQLSWTWWRRFEAEGQPALAQNCHGLAGMTIAMLAITAAHLVAEILSCSPWTVFKSSYPPQIHGSVGYYGGGGNANAVANGNGTILLTTVGGQEEQVWLQDLEAQQQRAATPAMSR